MRFVLVAFILFGVALYLANPQSFGVGQRLELSEGRPVARIGKRLNFSKIGDFGTEMFDIVVVASNRAAENYAASGNQVYRAAKQPLTYQEQLSAIASVLALEPETTAENMYGATKSCLEADSSEAPPQLVNYLSGLVQSVALIADLTGDEKAEQFSALNAPLNEALGTWFAFMPEDQRAENQLVLEGWATRPRALVACNLKWLNKLR